MKAGHLPYLALSVLLLGAAVFTTIADRTVGMQLLQQAESFRQRGQYDRAAERYQALLQDARSQYGADSARVADALDCQAALFMDEHKYSLAEGNYLQARVIREHLFGLESMQTLESLFKLGALYTDRSNFGEAETTYARALPLAEKLEKMPPSDPLKLLSERVLGPGDPELARLLSDIGWMYGKQGNYVKSEQAYKRALAIRQRALGEKHPSTRKNLEDLELLYSLERKFSSGK